MIEGLRTILAAEPRIAYALMFGSQARGRARSDSDVDVAIGVSAPLDHREIADLVARLESACGRDVDLVLMNEAPPALAYRVFQHGEVVLDRDRPALVARKARAILDYLDFKPIEDLCTRGVLAAASRGR